MINKNDAKLNTIKKCFMIFINILEKEKLCRLPTKDNIISYDIETLKNLMDVLFMKYIEESLVYSNSSSAKVNAAYSHIEKMILEYNNGQYIKKPSTDNKTNCSNIFMIND